MRKVWYSDANLRRRLWFSLTSHFNSQQYKHSINVDFFLRICIHFNLHKLIMSPYLNFSKEKQPNARKKPDTEPWAMLSRPTIMKTATHQDYNAPWCTSLLKKWHVSNAARKAIMQTNVRKDTSHSFPAMPTKTTTQCLKSLTSINMWSPGRLQWRHKCNSDLSKGKIKTVELHWMTCLDSLCVYIYVLYMVPSLFLVSIT